MKKMMILTLCGVTALSILAGAGSVAEAQTAADRVQQETIVGEDSATWGPALEDDASVIGMPNPFHDFTSMKEAQKYAGFQMKLPKKIKGYNKMEIQAVKDDLIQVIYSVKGRENSKTVYIRKGAGVDDVSGDYNKYEYEKTVVSGKKEITFKGNGGKLYLATWKDGEYSYSVSFSNGTSEKKLSSIAAVVK